MLLEDKFLNLCPLNEDVEVTILCNNNLSFLQIDNFLNFQVLIESALEFFSIRIELDTTSPLFGQHKSMISIVKFNQRILQLNSFQFSVVRYDEHHRSIYNVVLAQHAHLVSLQKDHVVNGEVLVQLDLGGVGVGQVELEQAEGFGRWYFGDDGS